LCRTLPNGHLIKREASFLGALGAEEDGRLELLDLGLGWTTSRQGSNRHAGDFDAAIGAGVFLSS
jgi:hypothetical protein